MRRPARDADRGMVTAELAVVLPALVAVLAVALVGVAAGVADLRCVDAARAGARALARGETTAAALSAAKAAAPAGAEVRVRSGGGRVTVTVVARVGLPRLSTALPALRVSATGTAELEPGVDPAAVEPGAWP